MSGKDKGYEYSRLVTVSGEDSTPIEGKYLSTSKTNFSVDFGYNLQQIKRVSVINVSFMNNAFNVIDDPPNKSNNQFLIYLALNDTVLTSQLYTIEPGFYNITQLLADLNAAAVNFKTLEPLAPASVVFSQSTQSGFVSITASTLPAGYSWHIYDSDGENNVTRRGPVHLAGFQKQGIRSGPAGGTETATELPKLQGLTEVRVVSQAIATSNCFDEKNQASSVLVVVPITVPFGFLNVFECKQDALCEISYSTNRNIQRADFSLRDRFGELIDLNGSNLKLTLKVWYNSY